MVTMNTTPPVSPSRHIVPSSNSKRGGCSLPQSTSHLRRRRALSATWAPTLPQDPFDSRGFTNIRAICSHCNEVYRPEFSPCAPHCSIDCRTMDKLYARHLKKRLSAAEHADTEIENEENQQHHHDPAQPHQAPEAGSDPRLPSPPDTTLNTNRPRAKSAPAAPDGPPSSTTTTNSSTGHPRSKSKSPTTKSGLHLMLSMDDESRRSQKEYALAAAPSGANAPPYSNQQHV